MPATPAIIPRAQPLLGPTDIGDAGEVIASDGLGGVYWVSQSSGVTDHGDLTGLADDDHPQYVRSDGRPGGQTIYGGTGTGELLTLQAVVGSTSGSVRVGYAGSTYYTLQVFANQVRFNHAIVGTQGIVDTSSTNTPKVKLTAAGEYGWTNGAPTALNSDTTLKRDAAGVVGSNNAFRASEFRAIPVTDAARPAAGIAGRVIYNSDDGNLNIDTGSQWVTPDGTVT